MLCSIFNLISDPDFSISACHLISSGQILVKEKKNGKECHILFLLSLQHTCFKYADIRKKLNLNFRLR